MENLFEDAHVGEGERFETLLEAGPVQVERIAGAPVEPGEYVQEWDEWVVLLRGAARLTLRGETLTLSPGDHLIIPAGRRHVVETASPDAVWLAVHLNRPLEPPLESG